MHSGCKVHNWRILVKKTIWKMLFPSVWNLESSKIRYVLSTLVPYTFIQITHYSCWKSDSATTMKQFLWQLTVYTYVSNIILYSTHNRLFNTSPYITIGWCKRLLWHYIQKWQIIFLCKKSCRTISISFQMYWIE